MSESKESGSDSEYEEEDAVILVDLKGVIDSDLLTQTPFERFKMIGVETENPVLQLNNYYFSGEYNEALGTALFFEDDGRKYKKSDPIFCDSPPTKLKYICSANKVLNMRRIFIAENKAEDPKENEDEKPDSEVETMDCDDSNKCNTDIDSCNYDINSCNNDINRGNSEAAKSPDIT